MELSIFLAKVFGLMLLLIGLGLFLDRKYYEKIFKGFEPFDMLTSGALSLVAGIAIVSYHNIWDGEWWVVLITIFGWFSLFKGFFRLLLPRMVMDWIQTLMKMKSFMTWSAAFSVVIGLIFSYYGFFA